MACRARMTDDVVRVTYLATNVAHAVRPYVVRLLDACEFSTCSAVRSTCRAHADSDSIKNGSLVGVCSEFGRVGGGEGAGMVMYVGRTGTWAGRAGRE